jgi:site-specific DNA-cytosine methylase
MLGIRFMVGSPPCQGFSNEHPEGLLGPAPLSRAPAAFYSKTRQVTRHTLLYEDMKKFFEGYPGGVHSRTQLS